MFKFIEKTKGTISIFLTIILVPMLLFSGLIVDASRISLAKSMASGAGDLTMNAALANYDSVLKDVYGLFAMSQNDKEKLSDNLKNYFENTLIKNGIDPNSDSKTRQLIDEVSNLVTQTSDKQSFDNFMQMMLMDNSFTAEPVPGSSLADPNILKNEIVNYMKYRGPIDMGTSFLDALSSFSKLNEQTDVINGKIDTDNALKDVNQSLKEYYNRLSSVDASINSFKSKYPKLDETVKSFENGYRTNVNENFLIFLLTVEQNHFPSLYDVTIQDDTYYNISGFPNSETNLNLEQAHDNLKGIYNSLINSTTFNAKQADLNKSVKLYTSSVNPVDALNYFNTYISKDYIDEIISLNNAFYGYQKKYENELRAWNPLNSSMPQLDGELFKNVNEIMLRAFTNSGQIKLFYSHIIEYILEKQINSVQTTINNAILDIADITSKIKAANDQAKTVLKNISDLDTELKDWKENSLDKYDSQDSFKQSMLEEWKNKQDTFNPAEIQKITDRLERDNDFYKSVESQLKKFEYGTLKLKDIKNYQDVQKAVGSQSCVKSLAEADNIFKSLYTAGTLPEDTSSNLTELPLNFYNYLQKTFYGATEDANQIKTQSDYNNSVNTIVDQNNVGLNQAQTANSDDRYNSPKYPELPSQLEESSSNKSNQNAKSSTIPKMSMGNNPNDTSEFKQQSGLVTDIFKSLKDLGLSTRDNLYVMDYATSMFSDYISDKDPKRLENTGGKLLTLSGVEINRDNNHFYGSEVEYILYGRNSPMENVEAAKSRIFAVRFVCNSIYALTDGEIRAMTLPPAAAISAATCGVVPVFLVQGVIELALALAESSWDMHKMYNGEKVAIFKSEQTWVMSPTGAGQELKTLVQDEVKTQSAEAATAANNAIQKLIDSSADNVSGMVNDVTVALQNATQEKFDQAAKNVIAQYNETLCSALRQAIDQTINETDQKLVNLDDLVDKVFNNVDAIIQENIKKEQIQDLQNLEQWVFTNVILINESDLRNQVKGKIQDLRNNVQNTPSDLINSLTAIITNQVNDQIKEVTSHVQEIAQNKIGEVKSKLESASQQGVDKAKDKMLEVTNSYLDGIGGSTKVGDGTLIENKPNAMQTLLAFGYTDYLKLFLFINLIGNSGLELRRIADLIQINITSANDKSVLKHQSGSSFRMSKAYTYIGLDADLGLKTMFMNIPLFTSYANKSGVNYLEFHYKSVLGY